MPTGATPLDRPGRPFPIRGLRRWVRPGSAAALAAAAWVVAPQVVPNAAFRVLSAAAVGILVGDYPYLRFFWTRVFTRRGPRHRPQAWLLRTAQLVFCGLIAWFLLGSMVSPVILLWGFPLGPVMLAASVILVAVPSVYRFCVLAAAWFDGLPKWSQTLGAGVVLGCFFTVEFLVGTAVRVIPDWDAGTIYSNAAGLATGSLRTIDSDYYAMYPNNIMLTFVLAGYLSLLQQAGAGDLFLGAIALNAAVLTAAVLLVAIVARRVAGTATAMFALLPCGVYIALSPWVAVPYSDTLGMVFPVLLLYLFLLSQQAKKPARAAGLWAAMGLVTAVGFYIKPTIVFVLAAAAVAVVFASGSPLRNRRRLAGAAACVAVALGTLVAANVAIKTAVAASPAMSFDLANNDKEFPVTHFLKMGSTGLGGFYGPDVTETKAIHSVQGRFQNGIDVYVDRVSRMGAWGYLDFLNVKGKAILGDGTFFNWGEGMARMPVELLAHDPVSRVIQDYFYYEGPHFAFLRAFWQSFWLATLLLVAAPLLLRGRSLHQPAAVVMRLSLFALLLFLLFFEGRSRYLYMYLPFFIVLASLSVAALAGRAGAEATAPVGAPDGEKAKQGPDAGNAAARLQRTGRRRA